jgi:hypothetical protein
MTEQRTPGESRGDFERQIGDEIGREIGRTIGRKIGIGVALLAGFTAFVFIGGFVVQQLWNWLLPDLFGLRRVGFWEALGLLALSRILFGGFGAGGHSRGSRGSGGRHTWKAAAAEWHRRHPQE